MTTKKKLFFSGLLLVLIAGGVGYYFKFVKDSGIISVQSGKVIRQDLTQVVSANGEIKPKKSVNISSNMMGRIVSMPVKEGDHVKEGDLLIRLESIQTETEGKAAQLRAAEAGVISAKADIRRSEADVARAKQAFDRNDQLRKGGLIPTEQFEKVKSDYDLSQIALNAANARLAQSEA